MHASIHPSIHPYIHARTHEHIHTYTHTYTHTHIHTHTYIHNILLLPPIHITYAPSSVGIRASPSLTQRAEPRPESR